MHLGEVPHRKQVWLFIPTLIGMLDLDGVILIMVMDILITDGVIIHGTDGADTQVTDGVGIQDTAQVMAIGTHTQHLMRIIIAEEVLRMVEITIELLHIPEIPFLIETALLVETVSIIEIAL
jgi:hypothetical protein